MCIRVKINVGIKNPSVVSGFSLCVLARSDDDLTAMMTMMMMMSMMMSLSWARCGGEGTRYLQIQRCLFHSETEGAPGSLTQHCISPMTLLPPSFHPAPPPPCVCHILTVPSCPPSPPVPPSLPRFFPSFSLCFQSPACFGFFFSIYLFSSSGLSWHIS